MKAVRIHKPEGFEGIDGLVYEDAPTPQPAIGDALVQVHAASFTPTELTWPIWTDRAGHDRAPLIPAHEGSGVVSTSRMRRRPRLASWRAASGERWRMSAISSNGTENMSCRT